MITEGSPITSPNGALSTNIFPTGGIDLQLETLNPELTRLSIAKNGLLRLRQQGRTVFSCRLLPCDRGYEVPAHYYVMKETTLPITPLEGLEVAPDGDGFELRKHFPGFLLRQRVEPTADGCRLETFIERTGEAPLPRNFNLLSLPGRQLDANARVLVFFDGRWVKKASEVEEGMHGKMVFAVQQHEQAFTIHSQPAADYPLLFGYLRRVWQGMVTLPAQPQGDVIALGTVDIRVGTDAQQLLEHFARQAVVDAPSKSPPTGWNSWDFYHSSITQQIIAENARARAANDFRDRLTSCVLDMGWETRFGEWEADPNFPDGMAAMAKEIQAQGFQPGIWLAPIIIDPECNFLQDDYRWVGMNKFDFPDLAYECCGLFGYILDVTRPEGEAWLFNLFRRFREMGYSYFKLDFLRFLMYVDHFHDRSLTPVQVMRKALRIVRRAVGEDAYIMGCNLPFEVGPGYVDGARVSGDVAVFWDNIRNNARAIAATYFFNGAWWHNDPDFLVVRGKDTYTGDRPIYATWWFPRQDQFEADPETLATYRRIHDFNATLSLEEARTHVSLEILLGGALVLGDPLMHVNEDGKALIRKALNAETAPGRPLHLFAEDGLPAVWTQQLAGKTRVGLFNWSDEATTIRADLPAGGLTVTDFWTGERTKIEGDVLEVTLQAHCCRVVEF